MPLIDSITNPIGKLCTTGRSVTTSTFPTANAGSRSMVASMRRMTEVVKFYHSLTRWSPISKHLPSSHPSPIHVTGSTRSRITSHTSSSKVYFLFPLACHQHR
ncbi:hypothetical protein BHE74_00007443 [Ensete ventricosum]|nr:hypothetical protein BHE74_00007443 [Ensete ventricosum]